MREQSPKGFKAVREAVLDSLATGLFQHEARDLIDVKNLLATGEVSAEDVSLVIRRSSGRDYSCSPHHRFSRVDCHVIKARGWYVKFYFLDAETMFISVHPLEM
jgi:hypothetical protein